MKQGGTDRGKKSGRLARAGRSCQSVRGRRWGKRGTDNPERTTGLKTWGGGGGTRCPETLQLNPGLNKKVPPIRGFLPKFGKHSSVKTRHIQNEKKNHPGRKVKTVEKAKRANWFVGKEKVGRRAFGKLGERKGSHPPPPPPPPPPPTPAPPTPPHTP